jgi:hypothetical protein
MTITKATVRKYLHLAGVLIAGGAAAAIWIADLGLPLSAKVSGTLVLATTLLTSLKGALGKADQLVDLLPIPDGVTTTTTTTVTGDAVGKVLPRIDPTPVTENIRPRDKGAIMLPGFVLVAILAAVTTLVVLFVAGRAHAADASPQLGFSSQHWSFQPASALAYQLNLRTGDANRAAALVGFSGVYDGWVVPVGGDVLCGVGAATSGPNAIQCNIGLLVSNFGAVLVGVQEYKDPNGGGAIYQGLLGVAGTLNFSGSPSYLKAAMAK